MAPQFENGFAVNTPFWHGQGTVVTDWPGSWDDAWNKATGGKPWDIAPQKIYMKGEHDYTEVPGTAIVRSDTGALLGLHSDMYNPITVAEFGGVIEEVMADARIDLKFDTVCVLKGGKVIAATLYMPEEYHIPGDPSGMRTYINAYTSHDASAPMQFGPCDIRLECMNTQRAAQEQMGRGHYTTTLRHTKNWRDKLEGAKSAIKASVNLSLRFRETAEALAGLDVDREYVLTFLDRWIPISTDMTEKVISNRQAARDEFLWIYANDPTLAEVSSTRWRVYQAVTRQRDWFSAAQTQDTRIIRAMIRGDVDKSRALRLLVPDKELLAV